MTVRNEIYYPTVGFLLGFVITLIGMTTEDIQHEILINTALSDFHHFIVPLFIGILSSITGYLFSKKKVQQLAVLEQLKKTKAKSETMISNISDVIKTIDRNWRISYLSSNIEKHFGWLADDMLGRKIWETVHSDDLFYVKNELNKILRNKGLSTTIRYRYKCKDNSYKTIQLTAINLSENPEINGVLINYKDISEQVKREQSIAESEYKYRTLFENMNDCVTILNTKKEVVDMNKATIGIFEYTKEEMLNMPLDKVNYYEDKQTSSKFFKELEEKGSYTNYEGRIITKSGKIKWIQVNSTELMKDKVSYGIQSIIRDITHRKTIELELERMVIELGQHNKTKDKLFSIIAHDLQSPFASIIGFTDILISNIENYSVEKTKDFLETIGSSAQNTMVLLHNLLSWAQSQTGSLKFIPAKHELLGIINEMIEELEPSAKIKGISLSPMLNDNMEVYADRIMLKTILRNLISNAVKFTNKGGHIVIKANNIKNGIQLTVSDNGVGMAKETINRLFEIDSTISTNGTANEKGTGLGLILCKEFVEKHKGSIWVESEIASGSEFKFTIETDTLNGTIN